MAFRIQGYSVTVAPMTRPLTRMLCWPAQQLILLPDLCNHPEARTILSMSNVRVR